MPEGESGVGGRVAGACAAALGVVVIIANKGVRISGVGVGPDALRCSDHSVYDLRIALTLAGILLEVREGAAWGRWREE